MNYATKEFFHHLFTSSRDLCPFGCRQAVSAWAYRFFRYGKANMDTLIGLGTSVAFLYSFAVTAFEETLRSFINVDATYYDVTIIVITFIALENI